MADGPLSPMALRGLRRLGDVIIPGDGEFPSFTGSGCIDRANELAAEAPPDDIRALGMLLSILAIKPKFALRMLCWMMMNANRFPEFIAVPLRQLNIGLRGLIVSPYFANYTGPDFSGTTPHEVMDYKLTRLKD